MSETIYMAKKSGMAKHASDVGETDILTEDIKGIGSIEPTKISNKVQEVTKSIEDNVTKVDKK